MIISLKRIWLVNYGFKTVSSLRLVDARGGETTVSLMFHELIMISYR